MHAISWTSERVVLSCIGLKQQPHLKPMLNTSAQFQPFFIVSCPRQISVHGFALRLETCQPSVKPLLVIVLRFGIQTSSCFEILFETTPVAKIKKSTCKCGLQKELTNTGQPVFKYFHQQSMVRNLDSRY